MIEVERAGYYRWWLDRGYAGTMEYLHKHVTKRTNASELLPGARSVVVCAMNYNQPPPNRAATVRERSELPAKSEERRVKNGPSITV